MPEPTGPVLHLGGNGHAAVRLDRARAALERSGGPTLVDVPYPGFEGRPPARSLDEFLAAVGGFSRESRPIGVIASGIGSLIALSLRARGELIETPMIFQGPVLWGLEHRWFPTLMRPGLARRLLKWAFTVPAIQDRFLRKHFLTTVDGPTRARFFAGYADCAAFGDFFDWFTPRWLRTLEAASRDRPEALGRITVWLGGRDHVVGPAEVEATRRALGIDWPVVNFPGWGHYPAIDSPEEWAKALRHAVDAA